MLEVLVEGLDAHRLDPFGDQFTDGVVDHGSGDAGGELEAIRQIRGAVEFAAAYVDFALPGLAKRDNARIEAMHHGAQREEVQATGNGGPNV